MYICYEIILLKSMELTEKQIIARIRAHGRGFVFTTKLFSALIDNSAYNNMLYMGCFKKRTLCPLFSFISIEHEYGVYIKNT